MRLRVVVKFRQRIVKISVDKMPVTNNYVTQSWSRQCAIC